MNEQINITKIESTYSISDGKFIIKAIKNELTSRISLIPRDVLCFDKNHFKFEKSTKETIAAMGNLMIEASKI